MQDREEKISNLIDKILFEAQALVELQDEEDVGEIDINQLASTVYEQNDERYGRYDEAIELIKSIITSYEDYKKYKQELEDKYDIS